MGWLAYGVRAAKEAGVLAVAAALAAALCAAFHPVRVPWSAAELRRDELTLGMAQGLGRALWVDARSAEAFEAGHVPGAVHLSEEAWEDLLGGFAERWEPGMPVVVYCSDAGCGDSRGVARRLRESGFDQGPIYVLRGGWDIWLGAGLPAERGGAE